MPTEPWRLVTDRWEWASISHLAPTVYHELSWTVASVARIRTQTSLPVSFGYARVWVGADTLVGCPLIRLGERWFNTPRAVPLVLTGTHVSASAAIQRAMDRVERLRGRLVLHDDSSQVDEIERTRLALDVRTCDERTYRSMSNREIDTMVRSCRWNRRAVADEWSQALKAVWNAGSWTTEVHAHHDADGAVIGYTVWANRPPLVQCIAAATVGQRVPAWATVR